MDVKNADVMSHYYLSLIIKQPFKQSVFMEVAFDNPTDRKNPLISSALLKANQTHLDIQSSEVEGLKRNKKYNVTINVYSDASKTNLLGTHEQKVQALYDEVQLLELAKESST